MKKIYVVKRININNVSDRSIWGQIPPAVIGCYPWDNNGYMPRAFAKLYYTDSHIHILLSCCENHIKAIYTNINDPVYKDSCLEFFFNPFPAQDNRYLNFEFNPLGTFLLGHGKDRYDRILIHDVNAETFNVKRSIKNEMVNDFNDGYWSIEFSISAAFIEQLYGCACCFTSGMKMKGNFYKCGDDTEHPHYGSWNKIDSSEPDFHRPECFGDLIFDCTA